MKIPVTLEGREGVYLINKEDAIAFVKTLKGQIHNTVGAGSMLLGCDWSKKDVVSHLQKNDLRIAIVTEPNFTMGHQLVTITNTERNMFDVGKITADDLDIREEQVK